MIFLEDPIAITLLPERSAARVDDAVHALSPLEYKLLAYLMEHAGKLLSRDTLLVHVWGYKPGLVTRAVDNTVRRLRKKLGPSASYSLSSVYGGGYLLELAGPAAESPANRWCGTSPL